MKEGCRKILWLIWLAKILWITTLRKWKLAQQELREKSADNSAHFLNGKVKVSDALKPL